MDDAGRKICSLGLILGLTLGATPRAEARRSHRSHHRSGSDEAPQPAKAKPQEPSDAAAPEEGVAADGSLSLIARGAILVDAFTGETIYEKNAQQRFYPASSTKILTALLVIEAGDLDKEVEIALADTQVEPSAVGFKPGERYTRRELLYALLLKSANDVAQALARDNAGSIPAFAEKMTRRAQELGATASHFMNPHGLHNPQHYTTPHDLALIARAAMQQPIFRQFVGTQSHAWTSPEGTTRLENHNKMLRTFPGCTGLKTGYTVAAQSVLVSSALRNNREVISVVMHSDKPGKWEDSKRLLTYGFEHLPDGPRLE